MSTTSDTPVRVGIAGLGRSGWTIHAAGLQDLQDKFQVVAVADANPDRRKEAVDQFGCRACGEFESLLSDADVDLFVNATPSKFHPPLTIRALEAGKDVVCEKPMAATTADADAMIAAARKAGRTLAVFQNRRYSPDFLKVREVIRSGKLGRIVMIRIADQGFGRRWDWQTLKEFGGGTLNNLAPHVIDQALQLFGEAEPEIFCHTECTLTSGDAEDHVKLILHAPGAPMIDIETTSACAYPQQTWLVMGTRGGLTGNAETLHWKCVDFGKLPARPVDTSPTSDRSYNSEELPWEEESWERINAPRASASATVQFYTDLHATLRRGTPLVITPESVRRQIAVIEKCHEQEDPAEFKAQVAKVKNRR